MHWGQIKTLLIVSFLILDIYLFIQFIEKKTEADIGILEQHDSTIEERLDAEDIKFGNLPQKEYEETFISVKQQAFQEDDLANAQKLSEQSPHIIQDNLIISSLKKPPSLPKGASKEKIMDVFNELVPYSDEYSLWNWNEEFNIIIFFQDKKERPVYYNQNGLVLLFLNDKNEIEFYTQTLLGETETLAEERKLIKPIQAIEVLYKGNEIKSGDSVESVNIGFHTRVPYETGVQVFAPIWKVKVNNEQEYFVNAIEGFTFSTDEQEFLNDVISSAVTKLQGERRNTSLDKIYTQLQNRMK